MLVLAIKVYLVLVVLSILMSPWYMGPSAIVVIVYIVLIIACIVAAGFAFQRTMKAWKIRERRRTRKSISDGTVAPKVSFAPCLNCGYFVTSAMRECMYCGHPANTANAKELISSAGYAGDSVTSEASDAKSEPEFQTLSSTKTASEMLDELLASLNAEPEKLKKQNKRETLEPNSSVIQEVFPEAPLPKDDESPGFNKGLFPPPLDIFGPSGQAEIPNPERKNVTLRSIIESDEFQRGNYVLPLPMGMQVDSKYLIRGLEDMPHLLVAGTTGSGKSVFMDTCILGMCSQRSPKELKLILVDPKRLDFAIYDGLSHLLARPIYELPKIILALSWIVQEMEARSEVFARTKVRNLVSYNEKILPKSRFPYIAVVIDEFSELMRAAGKKVDNLIARLAPRAHAVGIHLILTMQRPSVDVITGHIKANFPARVAFVVPSQVDSRTIIGTGGAEKLSGKGDMLFYSTHHPHPVRLQAPFITDDYTLEFVNYIKNVFGEPDYIEFEDFSGSGVANGERSGGSIVDDPKLTEAIKVVMDTGIASASGLQRYLNIGYPRAQRLVLGLEQLGIVGPQTSNSSKPHDILMDEESALDILWRARDGEYDER